MQNISTTYLEPEQELRHRNSHCEACGQEMGCALTPSASQDPAMSELVARLHAAEIAAEVGALHPTPQSPANSRSSSEKSVAGSAANKTEAATKDAIAATDAHATVQEDPHQSSKLDCQTMVSDASTQEMPLLSSNLPDINQQKPTKAATEMETTAIPTDVPNTSIPTEPPAASLSSNHSATTQKSRFQENIPGAAKSMPALTTTPPNAVPPYDPEPPATSVTSAVPVPTSLSTAMLADPEEHLRHKSKPRRMRWRPIARVHQGWMALRKKTNLDNPGQ